MISTLGYIADAWILATYAILARGGAERPFHWANAIGCVPIIIGELILGAYVPMVLTIAFGAIGWYGLYSTRIPKALATFACGCTSVIQPCEHKQEAESPAHEAEVRTIAYNGYGDPLFRWFCKCGSRGTMQSARPDAQRLAEEHVKRASK